MLQLSIESQQINCQQLQTFSNRIIDLCFLLSLHQHRHYHHLPLLARRQLPHRPLSPTAAGLPIPSKVALPLPHPRKCSRFEHGMSTVSNKTIGTGSDSKASFTATTVDVLQCSRLLSLSLYTQNSSIP